MCFSAEVRQVWRGRFTVRPALNVNVPLTDVEVQIISALYIGLVLLCWTMSIVPDWLLNIS